jgi:putative transposase
MVTPAAGREAVVHLRCGFAMSERRACRVVAVDRSSVRYRRRRRDDDALRERLKVLAEERRRFGYRRLWVLLRREGHTVNRKRVYRLYKQERLMVRRRGGRKRAIGARSPMPLPLKPNQRWSLDFVHDQMTDGSAWRWSPTHRSRASVSPASSTRLLLCVAGPAASSRIMAPS